MQVAWAVKLASRYIPHASCLTQSLTARVMLNWCGIENKVYIGVKLGASSPAGDKAGFAAHAWIEHDGRTLIGMVDEMARYSPILTLSGSAAGRKNPSV